MDNANVDLDKSIDEFFKESRENVDNILNEIGFNSNQVEDAECGAFLRERDQLLKRFEQHLLTSCSILKDLGGADNLKKALDDKIKQFIDEEEKVNKEINDLLTTKQNLRELLDVKSEVFKEREQKKQEINGLYSRAAKDEFVSLCKFMRLKFQWSKKEEKYTISKF